jgi:hypothetical protein
MGKGDSLVVDMSEARVRAAGTDRAVIEQYLKRGVTVRSLPSLHAKVFVLGDAAVVGSMNVSPWSRDRLTEAGILTTEPAIVDSALRFVIDLASQLDQSIRDTLRGAKSCLNGTLGSLEHTFRTARLCCMSSEPLGQLGIGFKREFGASKLRSWLRTDGAAGALAR